MLSRQRFEIPVAVDTPRFLSRSSVYKVPKTVIIETLRHLLDAEEFAFLDRAAVTEALNGYGGGGTDFSDYLIGASAARAGAATTYTFDRALRRTGGFSLPG